MALNMVLWAVNASECGSHFCEPIAGELKRSEKCLPPVLSGYSKPLGVKEKSPWDESR